MELEMLPHGNHQDIDELAYYNKIQLAREEAIEDAKKLLVANGYTVGE